MHRTGPRQERCTRSRLRAKLDVLSEVARAYAYGACELVDLAQTALEYADAVRSEGERVKATGDHR